MLYNRMIIHRITVGAGMLLMAVLTSCDKNEDPPRAEKKPTVNLATHAQYGSYLTDTSGSSLYFFSNDFDGNSNCTGGCVNLWPAYYAGEGLTQQSLGAGLDISDFGVITNSAGNKQTTYKSWPLYYYAPSSGGTNVRETPGQTGGEGFNNVWHVAKPDYSIMLVNAQLTGHDGKNYLGTYEEGEGKTLYFTDGNGVTLYSFVNDQFNTNNFTSPDFSNDAVWPIYETDQVVVPSTLDKSLFGSITVHGKKQLTYKGWPIYYFGEDGNIRGENKGVSFPAPGIWPVLVKDMEEAPAP